MWPPWQLEGTFLAGTMRVPLYAPVPPAPCFDMLCFTLNGHVQRLHINSNSLSTGESLIVIPYRSPSFWIMATVMQSPATSPAAARTTARFIARFSSSSVPKLAILRTPRWAIGLRSRSSACSALLISRATTRHARAAALSTSAAAADPASAPHLQLATAKLPSDIDEQAFVSQLFNWAATLTTNGRNLPFVLPLRTDRTPNGFQISLLRVADGGRIASVGDVVASVEPVQGAGQVLFVRLLEGEASGMLLSAAVRASGSAEQRLQALLPALKDVPLIMQTMRPAIKRAAMTSRG